MITDIKPLFNILDVEVDDVMTWSRKGAPTEQQMLARKTLLELIRSEPESHSQPVSLVAYDCGYGGCLVGWANLVGGNAKPTKNHSVHVVPVRYKKDDVKFASRLLGVRKDEMHRIYAEMDNKGAVAWLERLVEDVVA